MNLLNLKDGKRNKIVYTSDLHGDMCKYEALKELSIKESCDAIIIGGDIYKYISNDVTMQKDFTNQYLIPFFRSLNVPVYLIKGNTDCTAAFDILKSETLEKLNFLSDVPIAIGQKDIFGFDLINPSPFKIKNYERRDLSQDNAIFKPILLRTDGGMLIEKPSNYLNDLPSIDEELLKYRNITDNIMVIHAPPYGTKLDVDSTYRHVGSKAVYTFIVKNQPLLVLCGHIHESPTLSGSHVEYIGKTLCINPGQSKLFHACVIEIADDFIKEYRIVCK